MERSQLAMQADLKISSYKGTSTHEYQGGVFGSLMGTPIINLPQTGKSCAITEASLVTNYLTAVLGLHAIKDKPVAINGKVEIRPVSVLYRL